MPEIQNRMCKVVFHLVHTYLATEIAMAMFNLIYFACKCVETHQQKWQFMALKKRVISYMLFHSAP